MTDEKKRDHLLANEVYDALKFIALILLPAIGALYFAMAGIWGLPAPEKVIGSITALDTFLGVFLKYADSSYGNSESKYDGTVAISDNVEGDLAQKSEVLMKVVKQTDLPEDPPPGDAPPVPSSQ